MNKDGKTTSKLTMILIWILAITTLLTTSLCAYLLLSGDKKQPIMPDYMPVEQDEHVSILPSTPKDEPLEVPQGGGGAIIICDTELVAELSTGKIYMDYKNPANSPSAVVLQLFIDDTLIAQSKSILPGYQLQDMFLMEDAVLLEGGYYGTLKITFYDFQSHEKAQIDSDIEVSITVVP